MQDTMTFPRTRQGVRNLDVLRGPVLPYSGGPAPGSDPSVNVGRNDRLISSLAGGVLALIGLSRMSLAGLGLAALGGSLLYRGLTGHCHLYGVLGVNTAGDASPNAEVVYRPG